MSFRQKYQPSSVQDLVFRDPNVAQIVTDYAYGARTKHLLLEGPTSSGKSEAARMILKERLFSTLGPAYSSIYHGQGFNAAMLKQMEGDWNMQIGPTNCAFSVIDEVDFAGTAGSREIREFIDRKSFGTLICTTNNLHKLETAFVSRFRVVTVEPPLPADWYARAVSIFRLEGHAVSLAQVQTLFANFTGHARDFMDLVEDANINLKRQRVKTPNSSSAVSAHQTAAIRGVQLSGALQKKATVTPSAKPTP